MPSDWFTESQLSAAKATERHFRAESENRSFYINLSLVFQLSLLPYILVLSFYTSWSIDSLSNTTVVLMMTAA